MSLGLRLALIIGLCALLVTAISVGLWAIFSRDADDTGVLPPDYPPQDTEENQTPIPGDDGDETLSTPAGGGGVSITYSDSVKIDLSDKTATLYYANKSSSKQNIAIAVVIGEEVILRSELITPGNMIKSLPLVEGAESKLAAGGYNATLISYYYDIESGEKAMVDAKGAVVVTVTE